MLGVVVELDCVVPVGVYAGVGAEADLHSRHHGLAETLALGLGSLVGLTHHLFGIPERGTDLLYVVAVVEVATR